jgi:SAM-dependent methyltransferase/uncharacterized protein YbaR (Trm112 family)
MMLTQPCIAGTEVPQALGAFLDLLACPVCRTAVRWIDGGLCCETCQRRYPMLADGQVPVLLAEGASDEEAAASSRLARAQVADRFAAVAHSLPEPIRPFVTFLNLGYVADDTPQHATRGPARPIFNPFSTRLLFEVIGACDLDGKTTLELGMGRGGNMAMIEEFYRPRVLVGLDLVPANAEFCQRHHTIARGGFVVGAVEQLPFASGAADVVLSLESSHYYPDRERFYEEVCRVLTPGGAFLYADILPAPAFEQAMTSLTALGMECRRDRDISGNVLLSCSAIAALRDNGRYAGVYDTFLVVPGSAEFEALEAGRTRYKILAFRRT